MTTEYRPIDSKSEKEAWSREEEDPYLSDLMEEIELGRSRGRRPDYWTWLKSKSIWILHALLLLVSCTMFFCALQVRSSTLEHVRQFSAWCED